MDQAWLLYHLTHKASNVSLAQKKQWSSKATVLIHPTACLRSDTWDIWYHIMQYYDMRYLYHSVHDECMGHTLYWNSICCWYEIQI